jgi:hypothetical protein
VSETDSQHRSVTLSAFPFGNALVGMEA